MLNRLTLWVVASAAGCGTSIQATMINSAPHAMRPRSLASVEIFSSGPPRRPYVDVAYLEAEQQSSYSFDDTADFLARLREQAARMGCDGVVIGSVTHAADPVASVTANVNTSRKGLTATCIVYLPDAAAPPSNPGALPPVSTTATPPLSPSSPG